MACIPATSILPPDLRRPFLALTALAILAAPVGAASRSAARAGAPPASVAASAARVATPATIFGPRTRRTAPADRVIAPPVRPPFAGAARIGAATTSASDTFLLSSHSFDTIAGACNPRGWTAEDRSSRVFTHVQDRFVVNQDVFNAVYTASPNPLPSAVAGTAIQQPGSVCAVPDSGSYLYCEFPSQGGRLIEVYPALNVMRKFADLPDVGPSPSFLIAYDPSTGDVIAGVDSDDNGFLYRIPRGGGVPVQIASNPSGSLQDTTITAAALRGTTALQVDHAGNIFMMENSLHKVRILRTDGRVVTIAGTGVAGNSGDGGPATLATLDDVTSIALGTGDQKLYLAMDAGDRVRTIDLAVGTIDAEPGADPAAFAPFGHPQVVAVSNGTLYIGVQSGFVNGIVLMLTSGSLVPVAGSTRLFGPPAAAALGNYNHVLRLTGMAPATGGGIAFIDSRSMILRLDPAGALSPLAGKVTSMSMGARALWFGADSTSAPDEIANWVTSQGYGSGWSQRFTSPPITISAGAHPRLSFDAYLHMNTDEYDAIGFNDDQLGFFSARALASDGSWVTLGLSQSGGPAKITGQGVQNFTFSLGDTALGAVTRIQILCQSNRQFSNEDGGEPGTDPGGIIVDNVQIVDDGGNLTPPVTFEDGTTGAWTLSALNGAYGVTIDNQTFIRDVPLPQTNVSLRTGFDFADPSCAWTFLSPGGHVDPGTDARLTSPWIALADPNQPLSLDYSGKLATLGQRRVLAVAALFKHAGDRHPYEHAYATFAYSSDGTGGDISAPHRARSTIVIPDDLGSEGYFPVDSVQIQLQVEDREELMFTEGNDSPRGPSVLPYLDDIRVYQQFIDADHDGIADPVDPCTFVSAAGQDANGDGCPDSTATMRHVETWLNASRPIHFTIAQSGDPAIHDGSDVAAIRAAVASWLAVPGASVPLVEDARSPRNTANVLDGVNLITFQDALVFPPDVIAVTPTTSFTSRAAFDDHIVLPGQIVDSDLIFNPTVIYRTATTGPLPGSVDLQSVATHEIGHMLGLSHSGVQDATMFPVLQDGTGAASLEDDDRAAIAAAYPAPALAVDFGRIHGTLSRGSDHTVVPGALVTAWALDGSNAPVHAVASDYTDESGRFSLLRLPPGNYGVRVDPLDGSVPGLVPAAINDRVRASAQTNFQTEWWDTQEDGTENPALISPISVTAAGSLSIQMLTPRDITPPTIVGALPAANASDVGIDGRVLVNFSEPVDPQTLAAAFALRLTGGTGRLGGSAQILDNNRTFIFTPDSPLSFGTSYEIELSTELTDREGVPLAGTYLTHFQTLATPAVAIFNIQPPQAPPGALITINGQGFTGFVTVEIPDGKGSSSALTFGTSTSVVAQLPDFATSGPIRIVTDAGASNDFNYTVLRTSPGVPIPNGSVTLSFPPSDIAVGPDGRAVFAVGSGGFSTVSLDPQSPHYRGEDLELTPGLSHVTLSTNGLRAYATRPDSGDVLEFVTDASSAGFGHIHVRIPMPGAPDGIYASPDGQTAFVTESGGSHVWVLDVDPTSATYRSVTRSIELPGVTLTGGLGVSTLTVTASPHRAGVDSKPPRPHVQDGPFQSLFASTSSHGLIEIALSNGQFQSINPTPCANGLVVSIDGSQAFAPGLGSADNSVRFGCLLGLTCPSGHIDFVGRMRDIVIAPQSGAFLVVNSVAGQIDLLEPNGVFDGVVATGRSPVAIATSSDGLVTATANFGDKTVGLYSGAGNNVIASVSPRVAMTGDQVAVRFASGPIAGYHAELDGAPVATTNSRGQGLAFAVPALSQRSVDLSLAKAGDRTLSVPIGVMDRVESFHPHATGDSALLAPTQLCGAVGNVVTMAVSPDGSLLALVPFNAGCLPPVEWFQLREDAPERLLTLSSVTVNNFGHNDRPFNGAWQPDGGAFWVAAGHNGGATVYFPSGGATIALSSFGDGTAVAADPLSDQMIVATTGNALNHSARAVYWVDYKGSYAPGDSVAMPDTIGALAVSPDGRVVVAGGVGRAFFIDAATKALVATSPQHAAPSRMVSLAATANGHRAVGLFPDGNIAIWNLDAGSIGAELYYGNPFPAGTVLSELVPAPNGHGVIAGCRNRASLFRIDTAALPPAPLEAPIPGTSRAIARTPDGRHLVVSSDDGLQTADTLRFVSLSEATTLALVSGGNQEVLAGQPLPVPVVVHLSDAAGHPQQGAIVEFALDAATQGSIGDSLRQDRFTDADGQAQVSWTMPAAPDQVTLHVRAPGLPVAPLAAHATAAGDPNAAPPQLTGLGPADGSVGIAAGSEVFARFSQQMNLETITEQCHLLVGPDVVPGAWRSSDEGHTAFFTPDQPLPYLAEGTVVVGLGVLDAQGQPLAQGGTAHFTVQAAPALSVATVSPPAGAVGTIVTLNGEGFSPVGALDVVQINGQFAPILGASPRTLVVRVPEFTTSGDVAVHVGAAASNHLHFEVLPAGGIGGVIADTLPTRPSPIALVVTPDGRRMYVASARTNTVGVVDIKKASEIAVVPVGSNPRAIAMLPDGSRSYVVNYDGDDVSIIGTNPDSADTYNRVVGTIKVGHQPTGVIVLPNGPQVLVLNKGDSTVSVVDAQRGNSTFDFVIRNIPLPSSGGVIAINPDGTRAYVTTGDGLTVIDLQSFVIRNIPIPSGGQTITISPDGGLLYVTSNDSHLLVIDLSPGGDFRVIRNIPLPSSGGVITINPDGTRIYVALPDGNTVLVYVVSAGTTNPGGTSTVPGPAVTLTLLVTLAVGQSPAAIAVDPFGRFFATANQGSDDLSLVLTTDAAPTVHVMFPNGHETLIPGNLTNLMWVTDVIPNGQTADLSISRDLGQTWEPIATGIANTGSFAWLVSGPQTTNGTSETYSALFRATVHSVFGAVVTDASDAPFAIFDATTPTLLLAFDAAPAAAGMELHWQLAEPARFPRLAVERAEAEAGPWQPIDAGAHPVGERTVGLDGGARPGHTYFYRLVADAAGVPVVLGSIGGVTMPVTEFALDPITPNPARGEVGIDFAVAKETQVRLSVLDVAGRRVATLADGVHKPGLYHARWAGSSGGGHTPAGIYFVRYEAAGRAFVRRVAYMR